MTLKKVLPDYRLHKASNRAYSRWEGKFHYFGKYGTDDSKRLYREFLEKISTEIEVSISQVSSFIPVEGVPGTVGECVVAYMQHCEEYYSGPKGRQSETAQMKYALRPLAVLFGKESLSEFGPRKFRQCRDWMIARDLSRGVINHHGNRIKRFLRWCVSQEFCPVTVSQAVDCVDALSAGKSAARETEKVLPVERDVFFDTLPWLSEVIRAMCVVQMYGGMRPGEVCLMRPCDLQREGDTWLYLPESHKNTWRNQRLVKAIPKIAQPSLEAFLDCAESEYTFSPLREREKRAGALRTDAKRKPGERYQTGSYAYAIRKAIVKANQNGEEIPHWSPGQLRHSVITEVSQVMGRQAAQRWAGHASLDATAIYAEAEVGELHRLGEALNDHWMADAEKLRLLPQPSPRPDGE